MGEKLYTIPVNDAFEIDCECPICIMRKTLETNALEFIMGPSYMEDDIRVVTNKVGFCEKHLKQLYKHQNRLGLALILKTHLDKTIKDMEKFTEKNAKISVPSLFKKKGEKSEMKSYVEQLDGSCYICDKIERTFDRYIATIFYLYHNDQNFRNKFNECKGFCTRHFDVLHSTASKHLSGDELDNFIKELNLLYIENMKRVRDELEWFTNKFDYRFADEPWKNSKDALPRTMMKTNSITEI